MIAPQFDHVHQTECQTRRIVTEFGRRPSQAIRPGKRLSRYFSHWRIVSLTRLCCHPEANLASREPLGKIFSTATRWLEKILSLPSFKPVPSSPTLRGQVAFADRSVDRGARTGRAVRGDLSSFDSRTCLVNAGQVPPYINISVSPLDSLWHTSCVHHKSEAIGSESSLSTRPQRIWKMEPPALIKQGLHL